MVNPWFKDIRSWQKNITRNKFIIDRTNNERSLLIEYIKSFIAIQRFIKKNKLGFIKLNPEIDRYFVAFIEPRNSRSILNDYNLHDIYVPNDLKSTFNAIIDFFLDFHKCRA